MRHYSEAAEAAGLIYVLEMTDLRLQYVFSPMESNIYFKPINSSYHFPITRV